MKGGDPTKPQCTQRWQHSESLARHAWRFYLARQNDDISTMSKSSYDAWVACDTVWRRMKPQEQEIVRAFHTMRPHNPGCGLTVETQIKQYADDNRITTDRIWATVRKAWKGWAIERGLADE